MVEILYKRDKGIAWFGWTLTIFFSVLSIIEFSGFFATGKAIAGWSSETGPSYGPPFLLAGPPGFVVLGIYFMLLSKVARVEIDEHQIRQFDELGREVKVIDWDEVTGYGQIGITSASYRDERPIYHPVFRVEGRDVHIDFLDHAPTGDPFDAKVRTHLPSTVAIRAPLRKVPWGGKS